DRHWLLDDNVLAAAGGQYGVRTVEKVRTGDPDGVDIGVVAKLFGGTVGFGLVPFAEAQQRSLVYVSGCDDVDVRHRLHRGHSAGAGATEADDANVQCARFDRHSVTSLYQAGSNRLAATVSLELFAMQ